MNPIVRKYIENEKGKLSYLKFGSGSEPLLAFHGFGQSAEEFQSYFSGLENHYTVYFFDHFFHGESEWKASKPIEPTDFRELMGAFLDEENVDKFQIVAYSLGGKWAYTCFRQFPEQVTHMLLAAPDGARTNFYYSFSSRTRIGRFVFGQTVKHPTFFYKLLRSALRIGIIPKTLYRFVYFQMNDSQKRRQVYNTWTRYRPLKGLSDRTISMLNQYGPPVLFLLGKHDKVIREEWFSKFPKLIKNAETKVLPKGHRTILSAISPELSRLSLVKN